MEAQCAVKVNGYDKKILKLILVLRVRLINISDS